MSGALETFVFRTARLDEHDRVLSFYAEEGRPPTVFRRTDEVVMNTISGGRCFILERGGEIVASASLIVLPGKTSFGQDVSTGRTLSSEVNIGEVGSLFRRGDNPAGIIADLFYDIAVLKTCLCAMELSISQLTTQVVATEEVAAKRLERLAMPWNAFNPNRGNNIYRKAFLATLAGRTEAEKESRRTPLKIFYTPVSSVVDAAENLVGGSGVFFCKPEAPGIIYTHGRQREKSVGVELDQPLIAIDLRSMPDLLDLASTVVDKADILKGKLEPVTWEKAMCVVRSATSRMALSPTRPQQRDSRTTRIPLNGIAPAAA